MRRKGVLCDVGRVSGWNWRPDYHPDTVRREQEIIAEDLLCTAVKICGRDIDRLVFAADAAACLGLEVWFCPELWDKSPEATAAEVRRVFGGPITYAAVPFEQVHWDRFDIIGIDHYWHGRIADRYVQTLQPWLRLDKPVVISEFGFRTGTGADQTGPLGPENIAVLSFLAHSLPVMGRRVPARVKTVHERNEALQAESLLRQLQALDQAEVDGAFIYTFTSPLMPHHDNPRHDLDTDSFALVRTLPHGRRGTAYPDMTWEPKQSFTTVANYYAHH